MKQLYIIGIAVAVLLLLLLGLSKLSQPTTPNTAAVADSAEEAQLSVSDEEVTDASEPTPDDTLPAETETIIPNEPTPMDTPATDENTIVTMQTNKGDVTIELFTKDMPITAGNFLKLAQEDFYDGVKFHRVIDGFMIQGGDPLSKDDGMQARWGTGGPGYAIEDEFVPGFSNVRGTLSMANSGPNTGGSQFFINTVDNVMLDYDKQPLTSKHPVFGRVIEGMEVVDAISNVATGLRDVPVEPVVIEDIVVQ